MTEHDLLAVLGWCREGERELLERALQPVDLGEPSALPGWSRAHLVAHLARNADALVNLVNWAATGVVTPMYPSTEARGAQIEADVPQSPGWLRERLSSSSANLLERLADLPPDGWQAEVGTAQGRTVPASEIPWMRTRESFIHLVDLRLDFDFGDIPDAVTDALLDDVTASLGARDECPAALLEPTDRERSWSLGTPGAASPVLRAPAAELLAWVTGRAAADSPALTTAPELPRWL
ncbi:MAG TPA: maleylpyruvate isomerase family mycothiol-dependent enzyme [Acidimicrobiales bacterium]|nr:maleylpyruvate isomerase family mycothiol-dependent enzyme [Acidimicrobiales bacterium]